MKKLIAERLLEIKAVSLQPNDPYTWASGIKSPIYCDNRLTLSYPVIRREIAEGLKELILDKFPQAELIAGTATAGIPHAAWVSDLLCLPMCYVRSKPKDHGRGNQIEGKAEKGQKVVVVEDLISTGGSVITAVEALRNVGCDVIGVVSIFSYELEKGQKLLKDAKITAYSLTDFSSLVHIASEKGYMASEDLEKVLEWKKDPGVWGKSFVH